MYAKSFYPTYYVLKGFKNMYLYVAQSVGGGIMYYHATFKVSNTNFMLVSARLVEAEKD